MTIAVFLPPTSAAHIGSPPYNETLIYVQSWRELDTTIERGLVHAVILDPSSDGSLRVERVEALLRKYPALAVIAYLPLTAPNMKAVLKLSRCGLSHVVCHPLNRNTFWKTANAVTSDSLSRQLQSFLGLNRTTLPGPLSRAVQDLFEHPHRYQTAYDLAIEAGCSVKRVYRNFQTAQLVSPKKLVTAAKLLRGYCYLQRPRSRVKEAYRELGYSDRRVFSEQIHSVFGCSPSDLKTQPNSGEVLLHLLEWVSKPLQAQ